VLSKIAHLGISTFFTS
jgi:hypothetical protein